MLGRRSHGWTGLLVMGIVGGSATLPAQTNPLADTIWEGNAEITIPKLVWKKERPKFNRVETVSTLKYQVPIQIWFWGKNDNPSNAVSLCFPQRKIGADPARAELAMFLGQIPTWASRQWEEILARRPGVDGEIHLYPGNVGLYFYSPRNGKLTFRMRAVLDLPKYNDVWDYRLEGSGTISGKNLKRATFVVTSPTTASRLLPDVPVRPGDRNLISFQGNITGAVLNIVKSTSKPSDQGPAQFDKFFDLQDQSP